MLRKQAVVPSITIEKKMAPVSARAGPLMSDCHLSITILRV